jgi:trehalose-6-phosphate synthase
MRTMRRNVRKQDIYWWVDSFLDAVFSHKLKEFPPLNEYVHLRTAAHFQGDTV